MRKLYLIRHAQPDYPGGVPHCCGSVTDLPLSPLGLLQAADLAAYFRDIPLSGVYASPMLRARQTAEALARGRCAVRIVPGMEEVDNGAWDGLSFDFIRAAYPEAYERRALDPFRYPPPGAERYHHALLRGLAAIIPVICASSGDIALVAHGAMNKVLLRFWSGDYETHLFRMPQSFACVNTVDITDEKNIRVAEIGRVVVRSRPDEARPV